MRSELYNLKCWTKWARGFFNIKASSGERCNVTQAFQQNTPVRQLYTTLVINAYFMN